MKMAATIKSTIRHTTPRKIDVGSSAIEARSIVPSLDAPIFQRFTGFSSAMLPTRRRAQTHREAAPPCAGARLLRAPNRNFARCNRRRPSCRATTRPKTEAANRSNDLRSTKSRREHGRAQIPPAAAHPPRWPHRPTGAPVQRSPTPKAEWALAMRPCPGNKPPAPPRAQEQGPPALTPGLQLRISMCLADRSGRTSGRSGSCRRSARRSLNRWRTRSDRRRRRAGDARSGIKCPGRIFRLNGQSGSQRLARLLRCDLDFKLTFARLFDLGLKIRARRGHFDVLDVKIFSGAHIDHFRVGFIALFPEHKRRGNLQFLRNDGAQGEHRLLVCGIISFTVTVFTWVPVRSPILNVAVISPFSPGGTSSLLVCPVVPPQEACTDLKRTGVLPTF